MDDYSNMAVRPHISTTEPGSSPIPDEFLPEMRVQDRSAHSILFVQGFSQDEAIINCNHYSNLKRLLRVTAYIMKFALFFKARVKGGDTPTTTVTAGDVE